MAFMFRFSELTDRYYRERFWPDGDRVAQIVGNDSEIFLILYRELYYRYVYAKIQRGPSMEHRWHSYHNYQALFGFILNAPKPIKLNLPNQWLWDIIDEFVYQFQSFCQYKANVAKRTTEELEELRSMESQVCNYFESKREAQDPDSMFDFVITVLTILPCFRVARMARG